MPRLTEFVTNGNPWGHPHAARAICPDGKVRTVRLSEQPSTASAWPARGRVEPSGPTVQGYVHTGDDGELHFDRYAS